MKAGMIDVGGWQTTLCMKTGRQIDISGNCVDIVNPILDNHRYPGDREPEAINWTTTIAREMAEKYNPRYLMLTYATPYFLRINEGLDGTEWKDMAAALLDSVNHFCESEGYNPIIVGTGKMVPYIGKIDLTMLDGLADAGGPVYHLAAVMESSDRDYESLSSHPHVSGVHTRDELIDTFQIEKCKHNDLPDLLVVAEPGYLFSALGSTTRPCRFLSDQSDRIPVMGLNNSAKCITDIHSGVLSSLEDDKTALIIIEGFGPDELSGHLLDNNDHWFRYTVSGEQYLAITTGKHVSNQPWPPGYRAFLHDGMKKPYPFSGYFNQKPEGTIGDLCSCRSVAVGTRSIFTHVCSGADITVECKVCNQYNHGSMAIFSERII